VIEKVEVREVSLLKLDPDFLRVLAKGKARVLLVSKNGCEIGVVIGKAEAKKLPE